jgi:ubiquinone/menaquinone biosynthesis C-methylase UbiE
MVELAGAASAAGGESAPTAFSRMDGEALDLPDASVDVVLCAFGLMYMPDPERALREMRRVLRPGGRLALAVWGERARCAWAAVFDIVDEEVASDVCPLFFRLGTGTALWQACGEAGFATVRERRLPATLRHADADEACRAALVGGPVALAWSRLDAEARERVRRRYVHAIAPCRTASGYALPSEFVVVHARAG